ncbi:ImmA/IrrE family metallo-endopeptidase [Brevundimonas sp.]|uniref:ImmA/IrrE family metallo-endopeptidase n=1 Tax=Brevundimonas sp. TaxID=1871086 RepID=UPI003D09A163
MADPFEIDVAAWLADDLHCAEEAATMADLRIRVGQCVATRVEDLRARATRESIHVSAYPLALWLATNWWRLRWEGSAYRVDHSDWKLSHMMSASGSGYVWPPLVMYGDGDGVHLDMKRSTPSSESDLRFIERFKAYVSGADFEFGVADFVDRVLDRLNAVQLLDTDLHKVWHTIRAERADTSLTWPRKLEATLGFDPEAGDQDLVLSLVAVADRRGEGVAEELAAAAHDTAASLADRIGVLLSESGDTWRPPEGLALEPVQLGEDRPYEIGYRKAMELRNRLDLGSRPLADVQVGELFGLEPALLEASGEPSPVGVSERNGSVNHLLLKSSGSIDRRFEIARLAADRLFVSNDDDWSLATRSHTARQQFQRAFAAEFLCPVQGIKMFAGANPSVDEVEGVAAEFRVSPFTVQRQMVNAGLLNPSTLG